MHFIVCLLPELKQKKGYKMKKTILCAIVSITVLICNGQSSQQSNLPMAVNIPATCEVWIEEIHGILTKQVSKKGSMKTIIYADGNRTTIPVEWKKSVFFVQGVCFNLKSKKFTYQGKPFVPEHNFFVKLESVRGAVYKTYPYNSNG